MVAGARESCSGPRQPIHVHRHRLDLRRRRDRVRASRDHCGARRNGPGQPTRGIGSGSTDGVLRLHRSVARHRVRERHIRSKKRRWHRSKNAVLVRGLLELRSTKASCDAELHVEAHACRAGGALAAVSGQRARWRFTNRRHRLGLHPLSGRTMKSGGNRHSRSSSVLELDPDTQRRK